MQSSPGPAHTRFQDTATTLLIDAHAKLVCVCWLHYLTLFMGGKRTLESRRSPTVETATVVGVWVCFARCLALTLRQMTVRASPLLESSIVTA